MVGMHVRHDPTRIRSLLRRRERDGLTYRELSEASGIPAGTLAYWSSRLRRDARPAAFDELRVVESESEHVATALEVVGPLGHRVRISPDANLELVARVLAALPC